MAIYRTVQLGFWTDPKVMDDFTPEDKYFYLYLFTNPQTNLCGCYEFSWKAVSDQTGYTRDTVERLLDRFKNIHKVIDYSKETKEVLILNWHKYNWTRSADFMKGLNKQIGEVKHPGFREYLESIRDGKTVTRPSMDGVGTTVTVTVSDTVTDSVSDSVKEIIEYLNLITGKNYKTNSKDTVRHIKARLGEGFTVDDFKTVIEKKNDEWSGDPKMSQFLRPQTLFGTKFESYLNQDRVIRGLDGRPTRDIVGEMSDW